MHDINSLNMGYYITMSRLLCYLMLPCVSAYSVLINIDETSVDNTYVDDTPLAGTSADSNLVGENDSSVNVTTGNETEAAKVYLEKYGYMDVDNSTDNKTLQIKFKEGLKEFQNMEGLNITGTLDEETKKIMHKPRCGLPDLHHNSSRTKRYNLHGSTWGKPVVTYEIVSRPKIFYGDLDAEIQRAFDMWSEFIPITFNKTDSDAMIEIRFGYIDGVAGTLGRAHFPVHGGNILFDISESWTLNTPRGINFLQVAVHEIGHSLGIDHSYEMRAIMHATYRGYVRNFALHQDDINAAQYLYGSYPPDICADAKLDAVVTTEDLSTYAFKDDKYWRLRSGMPIDYDGFVHAIDVGYPRSIDIWGFNGVEIDAAVLWLQNGRNYFFSGKNYYRYNKTSLAFDSGYPRKTGTLWFDCDED